MAPEQRRPARASSDALGAAGGLGPAWWSVTAAAIALVIPTTGAESGPVLRLKGLGAAVGARMMLGGASVDQWLGLPYAGAPVGSSRFAAALDLPVVGWGGVRNATQWGPACYSPVNPAANSLPSMSEDCLTMNVWRPALAAGEPSLPVVVFVHGGGFWGGDASCCNGSWIAARGIIVVSVNYRLGPLGFLATEEIRMSHPSRGSGGANGIADVLAALRFVQAHAVDFGADPEKITLHGQSAGSLTVCSLLFSPEATRLFHRAVLQSGSCLGEWGPGQQSESRALSSSVARGRSLAKLKSAEPGRLTWPTAQWSQNVSFPGYYVDGWVIPEHPHGVVTGTGDTKFTFTGEVLLGHTSMDGFGIFSLPAPLSQPGLDRMTEARWGAVATKVAAQYNSSSELYNMSAAKAFFRADGDYSVACPVHRLASFLAAQGSKAYVYEFQHGLSTTLGQPVGIDDPHWAAHGADVGYVFNSSWDSASPAERLLIDRIVTELVNFISHGLPNPTWPEWPASGAGAGGLVREYNTAAGSRSVAAMRLQRLDECNLWQEIGEAKEIDFLCHVGNGAYGGAITCSWENPYGAL